MELCLRTTEFAGGRKIGSPPFGIHPFLCLRASESDGSAESPPLVFCCVLFLNTSTSKGNKNSSFQSVSLGEGKKS